MFVVSRLQSSDPFGGEVLLFEDAGHCCGCQDWACGCFEEEVVTLGDSTKRGGSGFGKAHFDGLIASYYGGEIGPF